MKGRTQRRIKDGGNDRKEVGREKGWKEERKGGRKVVAKKK